MSIGRTDKHEAVPASGGCQLPLSQAAARLRSEPAPRRALAPQQRPLATLPPSDGPGPLAGGGSSGLGTRSETPAHAMVRLPGPGRWLKWQAG